MSKLLHENIPIFIPSYKRERVYTYENLPQSLKERTVLIAHPEDYITYKSRYPLLSVICTDKQGKGASTVKDFIHKRAGDERLHVCIILDDDLKFQKAVWEDGKKRFRAATETQIELAFKSLINKCLETDVAFTTFCTPFFNDYHESWVMNKRMAHSMFINIAATIPLASFSGIPTMEDIKFSLECYTKGLRSWTLADVAAVDVSKAGIGGESAAINRAEAHEAAARYLQGRWPNYVRIREVKNNKRHEENIGSEVDVTFYPSLAYKSALKNP